MTPRETALYCSGMCLGTSSASGFIWFFGPHESPLYSFVLFGVFTIAWAYLATIANDRP